LPRAKLPATPHGCKDATTDLDTVRQWWGLNPDCNIGIATGQASGVFAIDIDSGDAESALGRLEAEYGNLPPTVEAITARGRHLYFRYQPERPVRNSADDRIASGIHVRGNGGYTLAPPSVHPSGRRYTWSVDSADAFAAPPDWLLDRISERDQDKPKATPPSVWCSLIADGVSEGERNSAATRLAGYFLRHRIDALVTLELVQAWNALRCRPPLAEDEIACIVNSISGKELTRRRDGGH
jgi:hypothetical protein